MKILVTGGCGYVGTVLVPKLLKRGDEVTVVDTLWFGNYLPEHKNLKVIQADLREFEKISLEGIDTIIHMASIANDPCGDLNPKLTWEVIALATTVIANHAAKKGVKHFIYASSGSVYGIKKEDQVTEELDLTPITEYNKSKFVAERAVLSYADRMKVQIIRPATVCGYSPRMRLDISLNLLTMQALTKGVITVFGGDQTRPSIHIEDMTDLYLFMADHPEVTGIYNAGFENISVKQMAERITKYIPAKIVYSESNDPRSYRVNSDKLLATGFRPKKTIDDAIQELIQKYKEGVLKDDERYYNVNWMRNHILR